MTRRRSWQCPAGGAHDWDSGLCLKCWAESPAERASRQWNAALARLLARAGQPAPVPPAPDYSTPAAVTARGIEASSAWARTVWAAWRCTTVARAYRDFRRAVQASQLALALGPTGRTANHDDERRPAPRRARRAA